MNWFLGRRRRRTLFFGFVVNLQFFLLSMNIASSAVSSLSSPSTPRLPSRSVASAAGTTTKESGGRLLSHFDVEGGGDGEGDGGCAAWTKESDFVKIDGSPWLTMFGEKLRDDRGKLLDYWRVEKDDSAVIVTVQDGRLIFPKPAYRPGVQKCTLDFPGGRVPRGESSGSSSDDEEERQRIEDVAIKILQRELGIKGRDDVETITALNASPRGQPGKRSFVRGWPVNSSFSNQKLFGFAAEIKSGVRLDPSALDGSRTYRIDRPDEIRELLDGDLTCLQCRAVLLEYLLLHHNKAPVDE